MAPVALHLVIKGRVQGVGYRAWAVRTARPMGLRGWVRNRHDGSVEALLIGEDAAVEAMAHACRQGPRSAHIVSVDRQTAADDGSTGFTERPTG